MILNGHILKNFKLNHIFNFKNKFISATDKNEDLFSNKLFPISWTFDDGLKDLLTIDELLTNIGEIKFRFFISPYLIENKNRQNLKFIESKLKIKTSPLLTWDQVGFLLEKGHILGLHGYDHTELNLLSKNQINDDFELSIELLNKRLSIKATSFAYPFGRLDSTENLLSNQQIVSAKKFFSRIYLSDNRLPIFGYKGVYNRRYAEFDDKIFINILKGFIQKFKPLNLE
jgi:peptidoglycan/xylan/chitin deacetylase (PgdA/CDA1 family)